MPTPTFFTLLRDVSKIAATAADDLAAQSVKLTSTVDDIAGLTGKAAAKTAGVAGDDLAVGAGQIQGLSPARELPAIWRIARISFLNKLWMAAALLCLAWAMPMAITGILVAGGLFLAFEGGESLLESLTDEEGGAPEPLQSEDARVKGAIRTDIVLSLEILVISLAAIGPDHPLLHKAVVLLLMGTTMTVAVYGLVALIVRLDDMGLALARSQQPLVRNIGLGVARSAPIALRALGFIGVTAMFAVSGSIFNHLLHWQLPWGSVAQGAADTSIGLVVGTVLAGGWHLVQKARGAKAAEAPPAS